MTLAFFEAGGIRLRRRRRLPRPGGRWRGPALDRITLAFLGTGGIRRRRYLRRATWSRRDGPFHRALPLLGPSACGASVAGAHVGSRFTGRPGLARNRRNGHALGRRDEARSRGRPRGPGEPLRL